MEIHCVVTDQIQREDMVIGMNVLGDPKGFKVIPAEQGIEVNRTKDGTTETFTFSTTEKRPFRFSDKKNSLYGQGANRTPQGRIRAFRREGEDVLKDEEQFGVPPQGEGKEQEIIEKTWRSALGHDTQQDPNYKVTTPERLDVIWEELRIGTHPDSLELTKEHTQRIRGLLKRFGHIFRNEVCPVDESVGSHTIKLKPGQEPISSRQYPLAPRQKEAIKSFVNNMRNYNSLIDSCSPCLQGVPLSGGEKHCPRDAVTPTQGPFLCPWPRQRHSPSHSQA